MIEEGDGGRYESLGRVHRWLFRHTPAIMLAEPFELFLVALAILDTLSLVLHELLGSDSLFIDYYYGPAGLWAWVGFMVVANVLIVCGLAVAARHGSLSMRRLETSGLIMYAVGFGFYGYTNLAIGLGRPGVPDVFPIITECVVVALVLSCLVRALALLSPLTALAVTRVQRVGMIKRELRDGRG